MGFICCSEMMLHTLKVQIGSEILQALQRPWGKLSIIAQKR